jgi:uncharacterized protein YutD
MEVIINNKKYNIIRNVKDAFILEEVLDKVTDYFDDFDYILGDYAYNKLRLKGFNDPDNKNFKNYNDINGLDDYIKNNCAYGCRYFVISKVKDLK